MNKSNKGFTLIELLVVIAIIAILFTIGSLIYTGIAKNAKDSRKESDVNSIAKALEANYNSDTGEYPHQLLDEYFSSGSKPQTPEGSYYEVLWNANFKGFRVCATLSDNSTYCKESVQGSYIAQVNQPPPPPPVGPPPPPPPPAGTFPIGVAVDTSTVDWWNQVARPTDLVFGYSSILPTIPNAIGIRVMFVSPDEPATTSDMNTAHASNWTVTSNIETDYNTVVSKQIYQYRLAKSYSPPLSFNFAPTGNQLQNNWADTYCDTTTTPCTNIDHALVRNADSIGYQTQNLQSSNTPAQYADTVKALIGNIKPYIANGAGGEVRVQVSVNPPGDRCTTADKVIQFINSVTDGSANSANAIVIFVSPTYDNGVDKQGQGNCLSQGLPTRQNVMQQVVEHYRK